MKKILNNYVLPAATAATMAVSGASGQDADLANRVVEFEKDGVKKELFFNGKEDPFAISYDNGEEKNTLIFGEYERTKLDGNIYRKLEHNGAVSKGRVEGDTIHWESGVEEKEKIDSLYTLAMGHQYPTTKEEDVGEVNKLEKLANETYSKDPVKKINMTGPVPTPQESIDAKIKGSNYKNITKEYTIDDEIVNVTYNTNGVPSVIESDGVKYMTIKDGLADIQYESGKTNIVVDGTQDAHSYKTMVLNEDPNQHKEDGHRFLQTDDLYKTKFESILNYINKQ